MAKFIGGNKQRFAGRIDKAIYAVVRDAAENFRRILTETLSGPRHGIVYGVEREVSFKGKGGGEKQVVFTPVNKKTGKPAKKQVSFTAKKGQKANQQAVKFIANKGKKWREGKRNTGMHRASKPGEAPAVQTGALRKGITISIRKVNPNRWRASIGESVQSGRGGPVGASKRSIADMLEYGTKNMKPRPAWSKAMKKFKAGYRAIRKKKPPPTKG